MVNYSSTKIEWLPIVQRDSIGNYLQVPKVTYHVFYEFNRKFDLESFQNVCELSKLKRNNSTSTYIKYIQTNITHLEFYTPWDAYK